MTKYTITHAVLLCGKDMHMHCCHFYLQCRASILAVSVFNPVCVCAAVLLSIRMYVAMYPEIKKIQG